MLYVYIEIALDKASINYAHMNIISSELLTNTRYLVTVKKTLDRGTIKEGSEQCHPIFIGYEIKGVVVVLPRVGERWVVTRHERNGIGVLGIFTTSPVQVVWHDENAREIIFETKNSTYFVKYALDTVPPKGVE